jgi:hypothetical protein
MEGNAFQYDSLDTDLGPVMRRPFKWHPDFERNEDNLPTGSGVRNT